MNGEEEGQTEEPVVYSFNYFNPEPPKQEDCPECRGKGTYALLISVRPCEACGGTGKVAAKEEPQADWTRDELPTVVDSSEPESPWELRTYYEYVEGDGEPGKLVEKEEKVFGYWLTTTTYDRFDRLVRVEERFVAEPAPAEAGSG